MQIITTDNVTVLVCPDTPDGLRPFDEIEKTVILTAVRQWPNRKKEIAEALGITERTVYNRLLHYGCDTDGHPLGS